MLFPAMQSVLKACWNPENINNPLLSHSYSQAIISPIYIYIYIYVDCCIGIEKKRNTKGQNVKLRIRMMKNVFKHSLPT